MAASPIDLTTVAAVKAYRSAMMGPEADDLLQTLVTAVSAYFRNTCSRDFIQQAYTETRDGTGTNRLVLAQYPVTAVASVTIDSKVRAARINRGDGGWVLAQPNILRLDGDRFPDDVQNVLVVYTAGWLTANIPQDLAQACIETVLLRFVERGRVGDRSKTVSTGVGNETVVFTMADLTPFTKAVLDRYQKVVPT